jgi:hypothetical protein
MKNWEELTGKWIISSRFGKATFKVQVKYPFDHGWDYKWRWAKIEEIQKLNLGYSS